MEPPTALGLLLGNYFFIPDFWYLGFLARPIRQAFSLYIVARCFVGVHTPLVGGFKRAFASLPSLIMFTLIASIVLVLAMVPGCFLGFGTGSEFAFILGMGLPLLWMLTGLSLGPSSIVVEGKGPLSGMGESFVLAYRRRFYLLSFLGLLYLVPLLLMNVAESLLLPGEPVFDSEPSRLLSLVTLPRVLLLTVLDLPATIAPVVLYFQFKARAHKMQPAELAQLVDQISGRHQD